MCPNLGGRLVGAVIKGEVCAKMQAVYCNSPRTSRKTVRAVLGPPQALRRSIASTTLHFSARTAWFLPRFSLDPTGP
jgi:hypothetical protein